MDDVKELRRLLSEATPGPWAHTRPTDQDVADDDVRVCYLRDGVHCEWCIALAGETVDGAGEKWTKGTLDRWHADAALIAAMRNALPSLLDRLEAAEAVVEAGRTVYDAPTGDYCDGDCRALNHSLRCAETTRAWKALFAALARYDEVRRD